MLADAEAADVQTVNLRVEAQNANVRMAQS